MKFTLSSIYNYAGILYFCKKLNLEIPMEEKPEIFGKDEMKNPNKGMASYGRYSSIVFQMLATMALSFWGAKKLNDYWEIPKNFLTISLGLLGMSLAFYNLLRQLKEIEKNEK